MKKSWKLALIIIVAVLAIFVMGVCGVQSSQNKAINLEEQVKTSQSGINIQEKRRIDLIYNLADCVKEYDKHESETLKELVDGRSKKDRNIENATTAITAVAEAYPELKSNENYKELMNELSITENMIANYRNNYNDTVKSYNRYVKGFPARVFLGMLGYKKQNYDYLDYNVSSDALQNLFDKKE